MQQVIAKLSTSHDHTNKELEHGKVNRRMINQVLARASEVGKVSPCPALHLASLGKSDDTATASSQRSTLPNLLPKATTKL
jgi:hypothetical protein